MRPHLSRQATLYGRGRTHEPGACARSEVVISLFASQVSYAAPAWPGFDVDVVSTAGRPCTFNVGTARLALVIDAGKATRRSFRLR